MNKTKITKESLISLIEQRLSTYSIAVELNSSQSNVRYWLRKFGLNTKTSAYPSCRRCGKSLQGLQTKFCSIKCKSDYHVSFDNYAAQKSRGLDRKKKLIELKGGACESCGYCKNLAALSFHHTDPANKTFPLDIRKCSNSTWESLLSEAEKCQLLCLNCHMEFHYPNKT